MTISPQLRRAKGKLEKVLEDDILVDPIKYGAAVSALAQIQQAEDIHELGYNLMYGSIDVNTRNASAAPGVW